MPFDNTLRGAAHAHPSVNNTILPITNINSEPRPSLLNRVLPHLLSYLLNNGDGRYREMRFDEIDDYTKGIPKAAAMASLEQQFMIFRQFTPERIQVLWYYQWKVSEARKALNDYDKDQAEERKGGVLSFDDEKRNELLATVDSALRDYDTRVTDAQQILGIPRPNGRDMHSFFNLFYNHKEVTKVFFECCTGPMSDLFTLNTRQDSWLYVLLGYSACRSPFLKRILSTAEQTARSNNTGINLIDNTRIVYLIRIMRYLFLVIFLCLPYFTTLSIAIFPFATGLLIIGDISFHQAFVPIAAFCIIYKVMAESGGSPAMTV